MVSYMDSKDIRINTEENSAIADELDVTNIFFFFLIMAL